MDYFILSRDERVPYSVKLPGLSEVKEQLKKGNTQKVDDSPVSISITKSSLDEYTDFIETPVPLASDRLKQILEKYDPDIFLKPVVLADMKHMAQDLYWLMVPFSMDCLSLKSEFNKDGTIKKLVIDEEKAGPLKIFKIDGIREDFIIVTLDVAESILRRDFTGIRLKRMGKVD